MHKGIYEVGKDLYLRGIIPSTPQEIFAVRYFRYCYFKKPYLIKALNIRFWGAVFRRNASPKTIYKWWRIDCNLWEEKVKIFWFINYYKYSIWKAGKTHTHIKFKIYPKPKYFKKAHETTVYVGKKEFKETYKNNKWLIPINKKLNLELP